MRLLGNLKTKVEHAGTREEAKKAIEDAGMILDEEELDRVAGGAIPEVSRPCPKSSTGEHEWVTANGLKYCRLCNCPNGGRFDTGGIS